MARKVLLADDSTAVQKAVEATLEPKGFEVLSAANGNEAIQQAKRAHPDVILMDSELPEGDGYEICRRIKEDPELMGIPVILLAGEGETYEGSRGQEVGADGHLLKPFQGKDLIQQVLSFLDIRVDTGAIETEELEDLDLGEGILALDEGLETEELSLEGDEVLELTDEMGSLELEEDTLAGGPEAFKEFDFGDETELDLEALDEGTGADREMKDEEIEEFSFEEELEDLDLGDLEMEGTDEVSPLEADLGLGEEPAGPRGMKETEEVELGLDLDEELSLGDEELSLEIDLPSTPETGEELDLEAEEGELEEAKEALFPEELQDTSIEFAAEEERESGERPIEEALSLDEDLVLDEGAPFGDAEFALEETTIEWEDLEEEPEEKEGPREATGLSADTTESELTDTHDEALETAPVEIAEPLEEVQLEEALPPLRGEDEAVMEGLGQVEFQELALEALPTLAEGLRPELTEEDFGLVDPFSEEGIRKELARNLQEMVERILSDMAPPIVERVARHIALDQTERIVREEIERLKT